jgi:hypothetical protein
MDERDANMMPTRINGPYRVIRHSAGHRINQSSLNVSGRHDNRRNGR